MTTTLIQMTLIMACGAGWRFYNPVGLTAENTRLVLTSVVYYIFLPALVLDVLYSADLGYHSIEFSLVGVGGILSSLFIAWIIVRLFKFSRSQAGAVLLASAFPNVTYLGLPVLEQTFGHWAKSVAIQIDLFAAAPLAFTVGIFIARHYGEEAGKHQAMWRFLNAPPFWAALIAVVLNVNQLALPHWFAGVIQQLSTAVVPLMLFSLGLALSWNTLKLKSIPYILPIITIQLLIMPLCVTEMVSYLTMDDDFKKAAIIDMAMPSMILGIVFCDRYGLDSSLYAMAVTVTTLLSMITLPLWYSAL